METINLHESTIHHGHNIKRVRRLKDMNQDVLADTVCMSQQTVSRYEAMKEIDDEILERFAKALDIPVEQLKKTEENAPMFYIENNTFENENTGSGIINSGLQDVNANYYNPIEKVTELYERLLQSEKEKYESLEKRLSAMEEVLKNK